MVYAAGLGGDSYSYTVNSSALEDKAVFFGAFSWAFDSGLIPTLTTIP